MMVTKERLDAMTAHGCEAEGCDHDHATLFLHGRCHVHGRIEVSYRHDSGVLRVGCQECGKVIAMVAVASDRLSPSGHGTGGGLQSGQG